ncbi:MAG: spore maturation protein [Betaproteobacteria bacterium HGW-Betaproteobacteria-7]|jgi:spore maturation protein CgeB|nr:MAG: spore maturation protein [Betaproteobacteria bacterium HGW-Betaproteobacteria-7]
MKFLLLDGISGVPLGKEINQSLIESGVESVHFDALRTPPRFGHGLLSSLLKAQQKVSERDGFHSFPRLDIGQLDSLLHREKPSHVLVIGFAYKFFAPAALAETVKRHGAQLLLYDTDSCNLYPKRREFIHFIQNELPVYDRIFSFSKMTTRFFRDTCGLDACHLPFGALPQPAPRGVGTASEALFVGSADLRRIFLLEQIRQHVHVRGNRWRRNFPLMSAELRACTDDRPVWGSELLDLLQNAKIVLNITRTDFYGAETGINLRIFEALAAGSFLLSDYCPEIAELLHPGQEIETFRSAEELADKVRFYLANDAARRRIAEQGHAAFLQRHTWRARVSQLLKDIE